MEIEIYKIQPNNCSGLVITVKMDAIAGMTMDKFISLLLHSHERTGRKTKEHRVLALSLICLLKLFFKNMCDIFAFLVLI